VETIAEQLQTSCDITNRFLFFAGSVIFRDSATRGWGDSERVLLQAGSKGSKTVIDVSVRADFTIHPQIAVGCVPSTALVRKSVRSALYHSI
jgi:hypothetical protein